MNSTSDSCFEFKVPCCFVYRRGLYSWDSGVIYYYHYCYSLVSFSPSGISIDQAWFHGMALCISSWRIISLVLDSLSERSCEVKGTTWRIVQEHVLRALALGELRDLYEDESGHGLHGLQALLSSNAAQGRALWIKVVRPAVRGNVWNWKLAWSFNVASFVVKQSLISLFGLLFRKMLSSTWGIKAGRCEFLNPVCARNWHRKDTGRMNECWWVFPFPSMHHIRTMPP